MQLLPQLNFPEKYTFRLRQDKDRAFIYDPIRRQWLVLTPEEWVRQHFVQALLQSPGIYHSALILEKKILLNGTVKRLDLLVTQKTKPKILFEFKAPAVQLTPAVFEQAARYNSVVNAPEIILSNGLHHIYANFTENAYQFLPIEVFWQNFER